jgi:hypothetical protein
VKPEPEEQEDEIKHYSDHPAMNLVCNILGITEKELIQSHINQLRKEYKN